MPPPAATPLPPPEPFNADEQALRDRLKAALEEEREAESSLTAAVETHERTLNYVADRQRDLAAFVGLDDMIAHAIAESIRNNTDPAAYDDQIAARLKAESALAQAEQAQAISLRGRAAHSEQLNRARQEADRTVHALLACHVEKLAVWRKELLTEAHDLMIQMRAAAQFVPQGTVFGDATLTALHKDERQAGFHKADVTGWQQAAMRLRLDPLAAIKL
jgi:hypothetical protein